MTTANKQNLPFTFVSAVAFIIAFFTLSAFIKSLVLLCNAPVGMTASILVSIVVTGAVTVLFCLIGFRLRDILSFLQRKSQ